MIPARRLLNEIATSLRTVIAPAIAEPYPKAQAFMAAVILEFLSRQIEERGDIAEGKALAIAEMFEGLSRLPDGSQFIADTPANEAGMSELIRHLYAVREQIGSEAFDAANAVVRQALRKLLDEELKIAGKAGD